MLLDPVLKSVPGQFQVSFDGKTFLARELGLLPRAKPASSSTTNFGPTGAAASKGVLSLTATSPIGCPATRWHWHELTIDGGQVKFPIEESELPALKNPNFEVDKKEEKERE